MDVTSGYDTPSKTARWRRYLPLAFTICTGVVLSLAVFVLIRGWETRQIEVSFHHAAADRSSIIGTSIKENLLVLESVRALYYSSKEIERIEFREFVTPVFSHEPGVQALQWVPRVWDADRTEFEAVARRDGIEGFKITQKNAFGRIVPAARRKQYFPICFAESRDADDIPLGLDLATNHTYAKALRQACDTGKLAVTGRIPLDGQSPGQFGFSVVLPIYKHDTSGDTPAGRRKSFLGFVIGVFRIGDIVKSGIAPLSSQGIDVHLCDKSAPRDQRFLCAYLARTRRQPFRPATQCDTSGLTSMSHAATLEVAGRRWSVLCTPAPTFVAIRRTWHPWNLLAGGFILTGLLAAFVFAGIGRNARTEQLVQQRTSQLRQSEEWFRKMTAATQDAIVTMDPQGNISFWNEAAAKIFGHAAKEALGKDVHELLTPSRYHEAHREHFPEFQRTGKGAALGKVLELDAIRKNGEEFPVELSLSQVMIDGRWHAIAVIRDITQRKRIEQKLQDYTVALESVNKALEKSNKVAEAATRAKSRFLANMSHEIRTPMTAILGFADILLENVSQPENIEAAKTIKRNGKYLLGLINDILDLSKIEAGKLENERITCSPIKVVADVASLMRVRAQANNLSLEAEYQDPIPETIQSDPTRLRQILINLVGNAIKFTETGGVRLVTRLIRADGEPTRLMFSVIDTGKGMTKEETTRLFQPFVQGDMSTTRKYGGTGLGLSISKHLAESLGGDITITSTPGKGSAFNLTVETGPSDGVQMLDHPTEMGIEHGITAKPSVVPPKLDCRVLLAEDGPDNQRLISFVLKKAGAEVALADNGQIACDKALTGMSDEERVGGDRPEAFDVILMDMQMPVMDGYKATRHLRGSGYTGPIIALTAHAMKDDRQKCLDAGCDDYAVKPIDRAALLETVAKHSPKRPVALGPQPKPFSPDGHIGEQPSPRGRGG